MHIPIASIHSEKAVGGRDPTGSLEIEVFQLNLRTTSDKAEVTQIRADAVHQRLAKWEFSWGRLSSPG